jgi:PH domain
MNIDDFLKEGGIDVNEMGNGDSADSEAKDKSNEEEKKQEPTYNTDPDEKMCGYLVKSSLKTQGDQEGEDILGMMISSIGSGMKIGLKMFTDTIQIKQKKLYFAIKNGILYWYAHERARQAEKFIPIKEAKAIEKNSKNPKEFYVIHKNKCYRLESEHEQMTLKWYNSLKMVKDNDSDHLDVNRYEKQKIFQRITGKSLYKDYELILE